MRALFNLRIEVLAGCVSLLMLGASLDAGAQSLPSQCSSFSDDPIVAGVTVVKAVHVTQLRACVDALRAQSSLSSVSWTDSTLQTQSTLIRAVHLAEIRAALQAVYAARGSSLGFSESLVATTTPIRASHVNELRSAARNVPSIPSSSCTYDVKPSSLVVGPANQAIEVSVSTQQGCSWQASGGSFAQISSGSSATGPGVVTVAVQNNTSVDERSVNLTIAGRTIPVAQGGIGSTPTPGDPVSCTSYSAITIQATGLSQVPITAACLSPIDLGWFSGPPASGTGTSVTILVNGSFDVNPPWMDNGSPEFTAITNTFGYEPITFRWPNVHGVFWPDYPGIIEGGQLLAEMINGLGLDPTDTLNVITHSHGGNVAKVASFFLPSRPFTHLINLGTPVNWDLNPPGGANAQSFCQVSSFIDSTQFFGSSPYPQQYYYWYHQALFAHNLALAMVALANDDLDGFALYSSLAATHEALAQVWWFTTKLQKGAKNLMFWGSVIHADLHEPPVWNAIKNECALN